MPYIDVGQRSTTLGVCSKCDFQWVIAEGAKGQRGNRDNTYNGRKCPFCGCSNVRYKKEDNR